MFMSHFKNFITKNFENIQDCFADIDKICSKKKSCFVFTVYHLLPESKIINDFNLIRNLHTICAAQDDIKISINKRFTKIVVTFIDILKEQQFVNISPITNGHFVITRHSLPDCEVLNNEFLDIQLAINTFRIYISELSEYLLTLKELDQQCWIIDPSSPTSKDNFRRIVIDENVSLQITVDPKNSKDMPYINVLGPSHSVELYLYKIYSYTDQWDSEKSICYNLLNMFVMTQFPTKPIQRECYDKNQVDIECAICFSSRNEKDCLPSIVCENNKCNQHFHSTCINQWLTALVANIETIDTIHGDCPCCSAPISCPVADDK